MDHAFDDMDNERVEAFRHQLKRTTAECLEDFKMAASNALREDFAALAPSVPLRARASQGLRKARKWLTQTALTWHPKDQPGPSQRWAQFTSEPGDLIDADYRIVE